MIRVACEACSAPFKIDERKLPSDPYTMRCPRCGCSFEVSASRPRASYPSDPRKR